MPEIKLETPRLRMREYTWEDFDALKAIISDAETMKFYRKPYDDNGVRRWIEWSLDNYRDMGFGFWAIELKETGEYIGDCGITIQNINHKYVAEIGYHIHRDHWNKGYATEAAQACKRWIFDNTPFRRVYSYMNAENIASCRVAEKNGMTYRETFDDDGMLMKVYAVERDI